MAKGIDHASVGPILTQAEWESTTAHALASGTSFPGSPSEGDLFYRTDEHLWYIYNGTTWKKLVLVGIVDADVAAGAGIDYDKMEQNATSTPMFVKSVSGVSSLAALATANIPTRQTTEYQPANPAATTSTTGVMAGCAMYFTPNSTGVILFMAYLELIHSAAASYVYVGLRYGTGTAPVNGAAPTGTAFGKLSVGGNVGANNFVLPTPKFGLKSGLVVGTQYWFDFLFYGGTGTSTLNDIIAEIMEI